MAGVKDEEQVLLRFLDGPLQGRGNLANAGGSHDMLVPRAVFGWPLPERLATLSHLHATPEVAMWDADRPDDHGLPETIVRSPNVVVYRKVSESKITDEEKEDATHVLRGAAYTVAE